MPQALITDENGDSTDDYGTYFMQNHQWMGSGADVVHRCFHAQRS